MQVCVQGRRKRKEITSWHVLFVSYFVVHYGNDLRSFVRHNNTWPLIKVFNVMFIAVW